MPNPMTVKGAEDLREEVAHRKGTLRQEISEAISEALPPEAGFGQQWLYAGPTAKKRPNPI